MPGEEKEQGIGNLCEKTIKENFPNLVKEIDMQVQEAQSPKQDRCKEVHSMTHIIKMPKVKDKDRILKATREKQIIIYKGVPIKLSADFSKETLQAGRDWQEIFKVVKAGTCSQDCSTQQSFHLESKGRWRASQTRKN